MACGFCASACACVFSINCLERCKLSVRKRNITSSPSSVFCHTCSRYIPCPACCGASLFNTSFGEVLSPVKPFGGSFNHAGCQGPHLGQVGLLVPCASCECKQQRASNSDKHCVTNSHNGIGRIHMDLRFIPHSVLSVCEAWLLFYQSTDGTSLLGVLCEVGLRFDSTKGY